MKYEILLMPWLWVFDENPKIEWKNPSLAFFERFWKKLKRWNFKNSDVIIFNWKKRVCYNIINN